MAIYTLSSYISICIFQVCPSFYFPLSQAFSDMHILLASDMWRAYLIFKVFLLNFWPQPQAGKAIGFSYLFANEFSNFTATALLCKSRQSPLAAKAADFHKQPHPVALWCQQIWGKGME